MEAAVTWLAGFAERDFFLPKYVCLAATSSSRYRGVFLAAVVAAAVATGFYHDVVFYISPAAFAIFLFALFPQQLKKILIVTLVRR